MPAPTPVPKRVFSRARPYASPNTGDINGLFVACQREALGRCLSEGHIAGGVSQDTCPMIMFMKIITGPGSRRVPSLENSGGLNFKLYCYPWKKSPCQRDVCTISKVSLCTAN